MARQDERPEGGRARHEGWMETECRLKMPEEFAELPDPFRFRDGSCVQDADDWSRKAGETRERLLACQYGPLPPQPEWTAGESLHFSTPRAECAGGRIESLRVVCGPPMPWAFTLYLTLPPGEGPFPVVLRGDLCWGALSEARVARLMESGYAIGQFNRTELAPDRAKDPRSTGLPPLAPAADSGALSIWAWGYHRCVDVLRESPFIDSTRIAVTGHSRGGKTALLAAATDPRIGLCWANNSGCGGAGCYRWQGEGSETLAKILHHFPYWFSRELPGYVGRENELPFDQHELKALIAPRLLLTTEALGDLYANPTGTWQTHRAAQEVYRFLGAEDRIGIAFREGIHEQNASDWETFLDFTGWHWFGREPERDFTVSPFGSLPRNFSWTAPSGAGA